MTPRGRAWRCSSGCETSPARHDTPLDGARALTDAFADDAERAHAFLLLTELALTIASDGTGRDVQTVVRDISLRIATLAAAD